MRISFLAAGTAATLALASSLLGATSVAAASAPQSDYGNTVNCRYRAPGHGPSYEWRLREFVVTAPKLYAKNGTQKVGWRFVVTRNLSWGDGPTKVTYRSPIQRAMATTTHAANLSAMEVGVSLPKIGDSPYQSVWYHVTLKLFWYRANGSVQSQTSYLMPWMKSIDNGHYWGDYDSVCEGGFYEGP